MLINYENIFIFTHLCVTLCSFSSIIHLLKPRSWVKRPFLCCFIFFAFSLIYEKYTGDIRSAIRYLIFLICFTLPILIFFQDRILKKISIWMFTFFLSMFTENTIGTYLWPLLHSCFHLTYSYSTIVPTNDIKSLCIYLLPMLVIECIVNINGYKIWNFFHLNFNTTILLETLLCPVIFASGFLRILEIDIGFIPIISFCFLLFGNLIFLKGLNDLIKNMKNARNNQKIKKNLELLLSDYEAMEQQYLSIRLQNHDIANHLRTVEYLISENQIDEAKDYLEKNLNLKSFYHTL